MIREFEPSDVEKAKIIHATNALPENCLPNLTISTGEPNALFVTRAVYEHEGAPAIMAFLKITAEVYVLVDHTIGTPEERWQWMRELNEYIKHEAWKLGLEQITAWVPAEIEESFAKRLIEMGYVRSRWHTYTLNLDD